MEINKIVLEFPDIVKRITGNEYGSSVYKSQVCSKIDRSKMNEIHFPDNVTGISISFIQGLMGEELNTYGKDKIFDHFKFTSKHSEVEKSIIESVKF